MIKSWFPSTKRWVEKHVEVWPHCGDGFPRLPTTLVESCRLVRLPVNVSKSDEPGFNAHEVVDLQNGAAWAQFKASWMVLSQHSKLDKLRPSPSRLSCYSGSSGKEKPLTGIKALQLTLVDAVSLNCS